MSDKAAYITIDARPYEDHDDCLSAAATDMIARHPRLRGWDLAPRWADDDREAITLTLPSWFWTS
jgi:hypothetical protein